MSRIDPDQLHLNINDNGLDALCGLTARDVPTANFTENRTKISCASCQSYIGTDSDLRMTAPDQRPTRPARTANQEREGHQLQPNPPQPTAGSTEPLGPTRNGKAGSSPSRTPGPPAAAATGWSAEPAGTNP